MLHLMRQCRGCGIWYSVFCDWLHSFFVIVHLKIEVCVGGVCVCRLYVWVGDLRGWVCALMQVS